MLACSLLQKVPLKEKLGDRLQPAVPQQRSIRSRSANRSSTSKNAALPVQEIQSLLQSDHAASRTYKRIKLLHLETLPVADVLLEGTAAVAAVAALAVE
jgi:hypothetical protein